MSYFIYLNAIHYVLLYTIAGGFCSTLFIVERTHLNAQFNRLNQCTQYFDYSRHDEDAQEHRKGHPEFIDILIHII